MRIVLSGVETKNKGAELMLYAILQELERTFPDAVVYIREAMLKQGREYVKSPIKIKIIKDTPLQKLCYKTKITGLLNRIGLYSNYLNGCNTIKNVDYFLDGSGLLFSDKTIKSKESIKYWKHKLASLNKMGAKIVFLPQGFGPFGNVASRETIKVIDRYADLIFAREAISFNELEQVVENKEKIKMFTDFTSLVDGTIPEKYQRLKGMVCIIPNKQMINKGVMTKEDYFALLTETIHACRDNKRDVYLLNHEGYKDEQLAREYLYCSNMDVELVTGLNALEVKGLISTSYLVVSSRYHGVASALNCGVPCIATSWHHKYAELFKDFGMTDCLLPLDNSQARQLKLQNFLEPQYNEMRRRALKIAKPSIINQNRQMWKMIWTL